MSHFAKIEDNIVTNVIVAEPDHIGTLEGTWVKTSYNILEGVYYDRDTNSPASDQSVIVGDEARERKNYAGIGYGYDGVGFFRPKPYNSWLFNTTNYTWEPPVAFPPDDGSDKLYDWNEENLAWEEQ